MNSFQYVCDCSACVNDYPLLNDLRHTDSRFKIPGKSFGTVKETTDELKKNCTYLTRKMKNHPSFETSTLLLRNCVLLEHLGNLADCPFKKVNYYKIF